MTGWPPVPVLPGETPWEFPPVDAWPDEDLVALGADLAPATLIAAYRQGLFPMPIAEANSLGWWSPVSRGILPLDALHISQSLRRSLRRFELRIDTCFEAVITRCAEIPRRGSWIDRSFIAAYTELHRMGWAHSVEVIDRDGRLAGGLYGVRIRGFFAGESMFHDARDASKVALVGLVDLMRSRGMSLLDVQWLTDHLASLGAVEIPRRKYLARLSTAIADQP